MVCCVLLAYHKGNHVLSGFEGIAARDIVNSTVFFLSKDDAFKRAISSEEHVRIS